MKLEFKVSLSLTRRKPAVADEEVKPEHRDIESYVENAEPQRLGFQIPTTGDERIV